MADWQSCCVLELLVLNVAWYRAEVQDKDKFIS